LWVWDKWWKATILHEIRPRIVVVMVHWQMKCVKIFLKRDKINDSNLE
jgi:hypothetical protein